jgi:hypothetical protein
MMSAIYAECPKLALCAEYHYAECRYAECRYAECRYAKCRFAECRGAFFTSNVVSICLFVHPFMCPTVLAIFFSSNSSV